MLVAPAKVMYFLPFPSFPSAFPITVAAGPCVPFPLVTVQAGAEIPHPIFFTDTFFVAHMPWQREVNLPHAFLRKFDFSRL